MLPDLSASAGSPCTLRVPWHRFPMLQHVDLTGTREFLTAEGAEEVLAPMLTGTEPITRVRLLLDKASERVGHA